MASLIHLPFIFSRISLVCILFVIQLLKAHFLWGESLIWFCYISFIKIWMRMNFFVCEKLLDISGPKCSPGKGVSTNNRDKSCSTEVIGNICYSFNVRQNSVRYIKKYSIRYVFFKKCFKVLLYYCLLPIHYSVLDSGEYKNKG